MNTQDLEKRVAALEAQVDLLARTLVGASYSTNYGSNSTPTGPPQEPDNFSRKILLGSFSAKQIATIQMVCLGRTTVEMGDALDCAESTAKVHIRGYMRKSQSTTRHKAASHYKNLVQGMSAEEHLELTEVEIDWAEDPSQYPQTTTMLKQKAR